MRIGVIGALGYALWELLKRTREGEGSSPAPISGVTPKAPPPKSSAEASRPTGNNQSSTKSKADLYARAQELGIEGRSRMSKAELERAIADAE